MTDRARLTRQINAREFSMLELGLYLDTHPDDSRALQMRQQLQQECEQLKDRYENRYGPLVVTQNDVQGDDWTWINSPWPWTYRREG